MPALIAVLVLLVVAGGVAYAVQHKSTSPYPKAWDPRVKPLADFVAGHRHLAWDHPVTVNFLSAAGYHKAAVGDDTSSGGSGGAADKQAANNEAGMMRALGLIEGPVDLQAAANTLEDDGTLAFYSPKTKQAYVRGTSLTPGVRTTLVHELTHALQDQHFDLSALEDAADNGVNRDPEALRALVEGDAMRVESQYHDQLSDADQSEADNEQQGTSDQQNKVQTQVPPALVDLFGSAYEFGEPFVQLLAAVKGDSAVDAAFSDPPTAFAQVWDPFVFVNRDHLQPVDPFRAPSGAKTFESGNLGSMAWYEMLIQRMPPAIALAAVDGWAGDQFVSYTSGKRVCVDARFKGASTADDGEMLSALQVWQAGRPAGTATVGHDTDRGLVTVHSCDPGPDAKLGITDHSDDLTLPVVRTQLDVEGAKELFGSGRPNDNQLAVVRCLGNQVVHHYSAAQLNADDPPADLNSELSKLATACALSPNDYPGAPHT